MYEENLFLIKYSMWGKRGKTSKFWRTARLYNNVFIKVQRSRGFISAMFIVSYVHILNIIITRFSSYIRTPLLAFTIASINPTEWIMSDKCLIKTKRCLTSHIDCEIALAERSKPFVNTLSTVIS